MRIILASGSPRRQELLGNLGIKFDIMVDNSEEEIISGEQPRNTVMRLAMQKARNIADKLGDEDGALVIGADTVVSIDRKIIGKPKSADEAKCMLKRLSGKRHTVYTGISVINSVTGAVTSEYEATGVRFRDLSDGEIERYVKSGEPMDKAGAYGIQNLGSLLVKGIDGDYFNVVGLPVCKLGVILKRDFGISII